MSFMRASAMLLFPRNHRWKICLIVALGLSLRVLGDAPAWWTTQGLVTPGAAADDSAVLNQGQLKHMAVAAMNELNLEGPGGAGSEVQALINKWIADASNPGAVNPPPDDFAPVNLGQLKYVAAKFYDQLIAQGYVQSYPWITNPAGAADDTALANVGQAKYLFSFDVMAGATATTMPSWWSLLYFGQPSLDRDLSPWGDGVTYWQMYLAGTNPTDPTNFYQGVSPVIATNDGFDSIVGTGQVALDPISITVTDANGMPMANAPVVFQVSSGSGAQISADGTNWGQSIVVYTNASGVAQIDYSAGSTAGQATVSATAGGATTTVNVTNATPDQLAGGGVNDTSPPAPFDLSQVQPATTDMSAQFQSSGKAFFMIGYDQISGPSSVANVSGKISTRNAYPDTPGIFSYVSNSGDISAFSNIANILDEFQSGGYTIAPSAANLYLSQGADAVQAAPQSGWFGVYWDYRDTATSYYESGENAGTREGDYNNYQSSWGSIKLANPVSGTGAAFLVTATQSMVTAQPNGGAQTIQTQTFYGIINFATDDTGTTSVSVDYGNLPSGCVSTSGTDTVNITPHAAQGPHYSYGPPAPGAWAWTEYSSTTLSVTLTAIAPMPIRFILTPGSWQKNIDKPTTAIYSTGANGVDLVSVGVLQDPDIIPVEDPDHKDVFNLAAKVTAQVPGMGGDDANAIVKQWDLLLIQNIISQPIGEADYSSGQVVYDLWTTPALDKNADLYKALWGETSERGDIPKSMKYSYNNQELSITLEDSPGMVGVPQYYNEDVLSGSILDRIAFQSEFVTWLLVRNHKTYEKRYIKWVRWSVHYDVSFDFTKPVPETFNVREVNVIAEGDGQGPFTPTLETGEKIDQPAAP